MMVCQCSTPISIDNQGCFPEYSSSICHRGSIFKLKVHLGERCLGIAQACSRMKEGRDYEKKVKQELNYRQVNSVR